MSLDCRWSLLERGPLVSFCQSVGPNVLMPVLDIPVLTIIAYKMKFSNHPNSIICHLLHRTDVMAPKLTLRALKSPFTDHRH